MEYCTFSYLAEIFDSHKIVDLFQLKEKKQQNNTPLIKDLFNDSFHLANDFKESKKSEDLLKTLSISEQDFVSSLNSE